MPVLIYLSIYKVCKFSLVLLAFSLFLLDFTVTGLIEFKPEVSEDPSLSIV